jgi:hypothetical protein
MSSERRYQKIPATEVNLGKRLAAEWALAHVEKRLGLPPIEIQWIKEISEIDYRIADHGAELLRLYRSLLNRASGRMDHSFKDLDCFVEDDIGGKVHPLQNQSLIYINSGEPKWRMT